MKTVPRLALALSAGLLIAAAAMGYDKWRGAEWVVSPAEIQQAKAEGKPGVESRPGTVTVLPIRSERADALPFKWAMWGFAAAAFVLAATRSRAKAK